MNRLKYPLHLHRFCIRLLRREYESEALPPIPQQKTVDQILESNSNRGFPGCLGSLDCTHVKWKAPKALQALYRNKDGYESLVVQAVAQRNLLCTGLFVGSPGEFATIII